MDPHAVLAAGWPGFWGTDAALSIGCPIYVVKARQPRATGKLWRGPRNRRVVTALDTYWRLTDLLCIACCCVNVRRSLSGNATVR